MHNNIRPFSKVAASSYTKGLKHSESDQSECTNQEEIMLAAEVIYLECKCQMLSVAITMRETY